MSKLRRRSNMLGIRMALISVSLAALCVAYGTSSDYVSEDRGLIGEFVGVHGRALTSGAVNASNASKCSDSESGGSVRWDNPFSDKEMRHGAVLLHCFVLLYMFAGLAKVCDDYFCSSLDLISEKLEISDDVAGATFMAAGGSAPEFATSLIGTLALKSDVGFATIIGSAVFNVLFVIGLCAYFSGYAILPLTWFPLFRDASFYIICLAVLVGVIWDNDIQWWESLILIFLYACYVILMYFDPQIRAWAMGVKARRSSRAVTPETTTSEKKEVDPESPVKKEAEAEEEEEEDPETPQWPEWPDGALDRFWFLLFALLNYAFFFTIVDCRAKNRKHLYMVTFTASILWIGVLSWVMVIMAEDIGDTLNIPENVMGIVVLASGTSIPDAVSSLIVARDGHGDMALSSSIGSNVFDITFGLPVPWFIYTAIGYQGEVITIDAAKGAFPTQVGILMGMVAAVVISIHLYGWKISKPLGLLYFGLYFVFVAAAIVIAYEWKKC
jgi:sodium/potassium/calcium exchanger 2